MNRHDLILQQIDRRVDERLKAAIAEHHRNARPGGSSDLTLGTGGVGAMLTPSSVEWQVFHTRSYPCRIDAIHVEGDPPGTATLDVKIRKPLAAVGSETSLFGGTLPTLDDGHGGPARAKVYTQRDFAAGWVRLIAPGSVLFLYVTAITGCSKIGISFRQKNLAK